MLCGKCEQQFSRYESAFSSQIFRPIVKGANAVSYKEWLLQFCVSLSWRVLLFVKDTNPETNYTSEQHSLAVEAEQRWRDFILGHEPHPGKFEQHLMVFTELGGVPSAILPNNINRYLLGGIEMDIIGGEHSMMTFVKIGRFALFGIIQRPEGKWIDTKVHVRNGVVRAGKFKGPPIVGDFILNRARLVENTFKDGMSAAQKKKAQDSLTSAIMRDPAAFLLSEHGRAMIADANMFGEEAITFKP